MNTLTRLKELAGGKLPALRIEVFSQGEPSMFADLRELGARACGSMSRRSITHRALVEADILVMSKGAFSYTAGVLERGHHAVRPAEIPPAAEAGSCARADGSFDEAVVARRLDALLNAAPEFLDSAQTKTARAEPGRFSYEH